MSGNKRKLVLNAFFMRFGHHMSGNKRKLVLNAFFMRFGHHPAAWRHRSQTASGRPDLGYWVKKDVNHHLQTDLEPSSIEALSDFKDFLFKWGFLARDFDVREWIDPRSLEAARKSLGAKAKAERVAEAAL